MNNPLNSALHAVTFSYDITFLLKNLQLHSHVLFVGT